MARKVVWAESAWRDLEQVADYIAQDSPAYAAAFVGRIRERASTLDRLAHRSRVVPELGEPTLRELLIGNYRLLYEIHDETIAILALIHGARDLAALWVREARSEREDPF
jgi:addiction module RelE/StbE family toxin